MKLLVKFNLAFVGVFAAGLGLHGLVARDLLLHNAQDEVLARARLTMEKASAVMGYTAERLAPLIEAPMRERFLPQSVRGWLIASAWATRLCPRSTFVPTMKSATCRPRSRACARAWCTPSSCSIAELRPCGEKSSSATATRMPAGWRACANNWRCSKGSN